MRGFAIVLLAAIVSAAVSYFIWHDMLNPSVPALPPVPTLRQRQFSMWLTPETARTVEKVVPKDFVAPRGFEAALEALAARTPIEIYFNWPSIEATGVKRDTPVTAAVAGMKIGDALIAIVAETKAPLICMADDDLVTFTVMSRRTAATYGNRSTYTVADLVTPDTNEQQIATAIQAAVARETWADGTHREGGVAATRPSQIQTKTDAVTQYDVAQYLNALRYRKAFIAFAKRAALATGSGAGLAWAALLLRASFARRRLRLAGCCKHCGYDLRASTRRCPECGMEFASSAATSGET